MSSADSIKSNWTRDADGNKINWTKPPYYDDDTGVLNVLLEGEDIRSPVIQSAISQRVFEYHVIRQNQFAKAAAERNSQGLSARDQAMRVGR